MHAHLILLCVSIVTSAYASPEAYTFTSMDFVPPIDINWISTIFRALHTVIQIAVEQINSNPDILPNTQIYINGTAHYGSSAAAISTMIDFAERNITFVTGNLFSDISTLTGVVGEVYNIAQVSGTATSSTLSNPKKYPYYTRITAPSSGQVAVIRETILYFLKEQPQGWNDVAVVCTTDDYGVNTAQLFIETVPPEINIATYQQFLVDEIDFHVELEELVKSGARVIVLCIFSQFGNFILQANDKGLVGDNYVWFVTDSISGDSFQNQTIGNLYRGALGAFPHTPETPELVNFLDLWYSLDPNVYFGAGTSVSPFMFLTYDMIMASALTLDYFDKIGLLDSGETISAQMWTDTLRNITFDGVSGFVSYDEVGDGISPFGISYYVPENTTWVLFGILDENGFEQVRDVVWHSNTTNIPDLDIREPFNYWSCHEGEMRNDPTGKRISLHTPDGSDIDDIDSDYHCDHFIDCKNMSDESNDCSSDFVTVFIVFGIVTGLLIILAVMLLIFVLIFGIILSYRRLRVASPVFMVLVLLSVIIGYSSIYAWFGKPHPVACAFQPWLLGLPAISMIAAMCAKTFRIWRLFRNRMKKQRITDLELFVLWIVLMIPAVLIVTIWTIVSTPTATMEERGGQDHYVCATGGFTGEPGGLIFFFILVAYGALVLLFGIFLSIVTRNVPSMFNESKLLAISIYNLGFLSIVIVPVFLVVHPFNPFIAWILRTSAILYAFTATLLLQFVPPVFGIMLLDKGKNVKVFKSSLRSSSGLLGANRPANTSHSPEPGRSQ